MLAKLTESDAVPVTELAEPFDIGLPTFLKHLKVLEDSGLIVSVKSGRVRTCRIQPKQLAEAELWLSQRRKQLEKRLDRFTTYVESLKRTGMRHETRHAHGHPPDQCAAGTGL